MSIIQGCPSEKVDTTAGCGCDAYKNSYFITVIKGTFDLLQVIKPNTSIPSSEPKVYPSYISPEPDISVPQVI